MKRLITSLLAAIAIGATPSHALANDAKLLVLIHIDQLRADLLSYCAQDFGPGGFKRFMNEALTYQNVDFGFDNPNQASAIATLMTGAYPSDHGISGQFRFDRDKKTLLPTFLDKVFLGNYTHDRLSPRQIQVNTLADELKIATDGGSKVYAVAVDAELALLMTGKLGDAAFWIEENKGKWASSTYYKEYPWWVEKYNSSNESISQQISSIQWKPKGIPRALPAGGTAESFSHQFAGASAIKRFKQTALVNEEVNRMALRLVEYAGIELGKQPNMMAVGYYAGRYKNKNRSEYLAEMVDVYRRLDTEIAKLLEALDKKVGLSNCIIAMTGSGYFDYSSPSEKVLPRSKRKSFSPKRCKALSNMYLMALYGQEQWISDCSAEGIFLDRALIERKKLNLNKIQDELADFVSQMSGVRSAITSYSTTSSSRSSVGERKARSSQRASQADVLLSLQGGWYVDNEENQNGAELEALSYAHFSSPLFLLYPKLKAQRISRVVSAAQLAPSLAYILRIRPPTASEAGILPELATY